MTEINPRNKAAFDQMRTILTERRSEYSTIRRQALIYLRQPDPLVPSNDWRLLYGLTTAIRNGDPIPSAVRFVYDGLVYDEDCLDIDAAIAWLEGLVVGGSWTVADHVLTICGSFSFFHQYDTRNYQRHVAYASDWFQTKLAEVNTWTTHPLFGPELPTYPDFYALAHDKFGIEEHSQSWMGEFHVLLPAYAVKIEDVVVRKKRVFVKVLMNAPDAQPYELRLWARHGRKHFDMKKPVNGRVIEFRLPEAPTHLAIFMVNTKSEVMVDKWGESRATLPVSEKPRSPQEWRRRILKGEDQDLEFKNYEDYKSGSRVSRADRVKAEDIARELVAFANADGGIVLIGVDDDRVIHGVDDVKNTRAKMIEAANNNCDPPITLKLFTIRFGPKTVVGASVEAGKSIHQAGQRVYIRRVETTRPAHSSEIERIQTRLSSLFGMRGRLF